MEKGAYFCGICGAVAESDDVQKLPDDDNPAKKEGYEEKNTNQSPPTVRKTNTVKTENIRSCPYCGTVQQADMMFCGKCGKPMNGNKKNQSGKYIAVIVVLVLVLLGFCSFFAAYMFYTNNVANKDDNMGIAATNAPGSNTSPTPAPIQTLAPNTAQSAVQHNTVRESLYSPSAEYKRMADIHNSVQCSDDIFSELTYVICDFDRCCEAYMNFGDAEVFKYLRSGTTAYKQQTNYKNKHPYLTQTYIDIRVKDAREYGGYYYVWVTEVLDVIENGKQTQNIDHWVYKMFYSGGGWLIEDYTKDPVS